MTHVHNLCIYFIVYVTLGKNLTFSLSNFGQNSNRLNSSPRIVELNPLRSEVTEIELGSFCQNFSSSYMSLYKLAGSRAASCNDGTQAGYYLLRQSRSMKWVIYLQGGWYCANEVGCKIRKYRNPDLTSSRRWYSCRRGYGILSSSSTENPYLFESNMVYIPYCSSDLWSGRNRQHLFGDAPFSFMGSIIIEQVILQLLRNHDLREASSILLAGSSAGGTGVFINVDRVQDIVSRHGSSAIVRGVADSAWYLKREEMEDNFNCPNAISCSPVALLKMGMSLWLPNIPQKCLKEQTRPTTSHINSASYRFQARDDRWKCFYGPVIYPKITSDIFIVQWLFDEVQLQSEGFSLNLDFVRRSDKKELVANLKKLFNDVVQSFENIPYVFASSCLSHSILEKNEWVRVRIAESTLPDDLKCWEDYLELVRTSTISDSTNQEFNQNSRITTQFVPLAPSNRRHHSHNHASNEQQNNGQCHFKAVDRCPLPQCNPTCPQIYDVRTHSLISSNDFLQLLGVNFDDFANYTSSAVNQKPRRLRRD